MHDGEDVIYRPTVQFTYLPAPDALVSLHEYVMRDYKPPAKTNVMNTEIVAGADELGVLLLGHDKQAFWYGSRVDIHQARKVVPGHNATTMQVVGGLVSAIVWCLKNPNQGYCETESLPYQEMLAIAEPYISPIFQSFCDWTPNSSKTGVSGGEGVQDPWQFNSFLVGH